MTRFQIAQIASVAMSATLVVMTWLPTVIVPVAAAAFATAPIAAPELA